MLIKLIFLEIVVGYFLSSIDDKVKTEFENGVESFFAAAEAVRQAQQNFDNAFPENFEIANKELTLAKERFDVIGKKVKLLSMPV